MNISHQYRCLFIHIPKCAGTSIKLALNLPGRGHPPWQYFARNFPKEWQTYSKFCVVRNPWDRVVSAFCYAKMKESYWHREHTDRHPDADVLRDASFADCCRMLETQRDKLKHESWHPQHAWIAGVDDGRAVCMVNHILRHETLSRDFTEYAKLIGYKGGELPVVNRSERSDYAAYYDDETREIIGRVYATDIQLLGYRFQP
jgi:hypothetical protein